MSFHPHAVPIGIVTRNRAVYLDTTLRSLSATPLSSTSVTVYDDSSDDCSTRAYLYTNECISTVHSWPKERQWRLAGLDFLQDDLLLTGIANRIQVVRISRDPKGVVSASCFAIRDLFQRNPDSNGVILLQDDLVFKTNWFQRLVSAVCVVAEPVGIISGITLTGLRDGDVLVAGASAVRFCTAQCYYLSRQFFERGYAWFCRDDHEQVGFDDKICALSHDCGLNVQLLVPFVCQHIGVDSKVRPSRKYFRNRWSLGRIGFASAPPYAYADSVRCFLSKQEIVDAVDTVSNCESHESEYRCISPPRIIFCNFLSELRNDATYRHTCQRDGCGQRFITDAPRHRALCRVQVPSGFGAMDSFPTFQLER
jgi:hypothetical protein